MIINRLCPFCDKQSSVNLDTQEKVDAYFRWIQAQPSNPDRHIQTSMPMLSTAEREILISGAHDACFNEAFPDE